MVEPSKFHVLPDPLGDRKCKSHECPANQPLDHNVLFPPAGNVLYDWPSKLILLNILQL
jgi:hypothetical protein